MVRTFIAAALAVAVCSAWAQDTRTVTEPVIPRSCTILPAKLKASGKAVAANDEDKQDTARIQAALDGCPAGQAVELKPEGGLNAFLTGPIQLRAGVTLVVDGGVTLFGSRNPRDYDLSPGSCGTVTEKGHGCKPMIAANQVKGAGIMGDGTIDGRGGAKLIGQNVSWWDLAQEAKVKNLNQNCPRILMATKADDFTLYRIRLEDSPNFHVSYSGGNGFTAWGVVINTGKEGRNTDGIDPGNSTNVTIAHCFIRAGDDNVAIKAGAGAPTTHMTIAHNHFYYGHGMSIGSETDGGASAIRVTDLSIDGADNGIRIKSNSSRGGLVQDIVYEDVCIRDTKNPIYMDSNYSYRGTATDKLPQFTGIVLRNVRVDGPGKITLDGLDDKHKLGMTWDNVYFSDPAGQKIAAVHAQLKFGPGAVSILPQGDDVKIIGSGGKTIPNACEGKFVPLPRPGEKRQ
jgi:polygalacturonase